MSWRSVTIRLPPYLYDEVTAYAYSKGLSFSDAVRECIKTTVDINPMASAEMENVRHRCAQLDRAYDELLDAFYRDRAELDKLKHRLAELGGDGAE